MGNITEKYKVEQKRYDDFRIKAEVLVKELLVQKEINYHKIESRIKEVDKLEEKIVRKNNKYQDISEITDLIGIRIITYFEDEVDRIALIIEDEFLKDSANSIDKRNLETDRFGYKSLHYVVSLNDVRKKLTEYKRFKDIKIEIQIRSILQHAWAEIEHDIGYKGELQVPNSLKRNFHRVAALLETADLEFVKIKKDLAAYEENVGTKIKVAPQDVEINLTSLKSYVFSSPLVAAIDSAITTHSEITLNQEKVGSFLSDYVNLLYYHKIMTIKDLDNLLKMKKDIIIKFANKWIGKAKGATMYSGVCIFYLCYVLAAEKEDIGRAANYYLKGVAKDASDLSSARLKGKKIIDTYKKVKLLG